MTDAEALAAFEALVTSQEGASVNWEPVTDYSFRSRVDAEGQTPDLLLEVFNPHNVIDAGCGFGHLVRMLIERRVDACGFDCTTRREWMGSPLLKNADLAGSVSRIPFVGMFSLVVCREVLEHMTVLQIRRAVSNLCKLSKRFVYVTTRFHKNPKHLLSVQTADDLDPTHISMLNQDLLRTLFVLEGFKRRADLETAMDWRNLGRVLVYER